MKNLRADRNKQQAARVAAGGRRRYHELIEHFNLCSPGPERDELEREMRSLVRWLHNLRSERC
jgi:hypothetical protein